MRANKPKRPMCSITLSQGVNDKKNWMILLAPGDDREREESMFTCHFSDHPIMDEQSMDEMMHEMAHLISSKYHDYYQRQKEANKVNKIAEGVVQDFFNRMKKKNN